MDNLIVIYNNLVDLSSTNIAVSSTAGMTNKENLRNNTKSLLWQSVGTSATFLITIPNPKNITGVAIPFCNLSSTATVRVRGWATQPLLTGIDLSGGSVSWDSGVTPVLACPWDSLLHSGAIGAPSGVSSYSYGGGKHARCYVPNNDLITAVSIEIVDEDNAAGYVEASRLVIGSYWSPKYNTSYGISIETIDLSKHERTDAGDLVTTTNPKFNRLTFDLKYLDSSDRSELLSILKTNGLTVPLFISLFPYDLEPNKERDYQIYGKLSSISPIVHPIYSMYSSQIIIEEI